MRAATSLVLRVGLAVGCGVMPAVAGEPTTPREAGDSTAATLAPAAPAVPATPEPFLRWSETEARRAVVDERRAGTAGSRWDGRVNDTHRAFRYKVRATLWTPRALRGAARLVQLRERLSDTETLELLASVESRSLHVVSIEIDPIEGSGVLPRDETRFFLERTGDPATSVHAVEQDDLAELPIFRKFEKRDYAYELLIVAFPRSLPGGEPLATATGGLDLVVDIGGKGERLSFPVDAAASPASKRAR